MPIDLPKPVADFVAANARLDLAAMLKPFAPGAVILDNGKRFEGHTAIRSLFEHEVLPVRAVFTPDNARFEDGAIVVEGPAHGDFTGSPIRFSYRFTLDGDAIDAVEISA